MYGLFSHDVVVEVDLLAGNTDIWRSITPTPMNGWQAVLSLFAPLAVLLLGIQLTRDDLYRLLPIIIGLGAISGMFGLLQAIGDPEGSLYFYRTTNNGSAVGLFANRNHAAVLLACLFPMLAAFASVSNDAGNRRNVRGLIAAAIAIVLVPLILVTGSRSGMLISFFGLVAAAALYHHPEKPGKRRRKPKNSIISAPLVLGGLGLVCMVFLTFYFSRAEAIGRLFEHSAAEDGRGNFWLASSDLFWKYFPVGSGSGSFAETYQVDELPNALGLTYLNHAHNDWIETAVTLGVPGLILLLITTLLYVRRIYGLWRRSGRTGRSVHLARMAGVVIAMIAMASFADYPLRTPIMMCFMAVLVLWFLEVGRTPKTIEQGREQTI
jgi:O-antigen ligase